MSKHLLQVINLGKRSFADGLRTQEIMRQRVIQSTNSGLKNQGPSTTVAPNNELHHETEPENVLLLVEHWPVFTSGLRDSAFTDEDVLRLKALGADVFKTNRGGLATFHGPGQLVAYPIINLNRHGFGLKEYVTRLERTLVDTCEQFGIKARCSKDTGVWVDNRKIASIGELGSDGGVNAKRHVTLHGIALNCSTDLGWFDHITPCGLQGVEMTSLTKELGKTVNVSEAECHFLHSFADHFDCKLSTGSDYVPANMSCRTQVRI